MLLYRILDRIKNVESSLNALQNPSPVSRVDIKSIQQLGCGVATVPGVEAGLWGGGGEMHKTRVSN